MRKARLLGRNVAYYHVICRVNHGDYLIDDSEKERLIKMLREAECLGLGQVVTYCVLDTHWHGLIRIDHDAEISEEEVLARVRARYGDVRAGELEYELQQARENGHEESAQAALDRYRHRMENLAEFMKDVQQRFTMSYNKRHGKFGRFWSDRYKSLLVQGHGSGDFVALAVIAGYIDLNPVRAHIVTDPAKYRFCGYGAAQAGDSHAQRGLRPVLELLQRGEGEPNISLYRSFLFRQGLDSLTQGHLSEAFAALARKVADKEGRLNPMDLMLCRVRYFSDGVAIGSRNFIEDVFASNRHFFGARRKTGARSFRGANSGGLFSMRDLRREPITVSNT